MVIKLNVNNETENNTSHNSKADDALPTGLPAASKSKT